MARRHVVVALSGGVDSTAAALLLKRRTDLRLTAVHMTNWDARQEDSEAGHCAAQKDLEDAQRVARHLAIPFVHMDLVAAYWQRVFERLLWSYARGLTPNPDVLCNQHIKFDVFLRRVVRELGADYVCTGHYARLAPAAHTHAPPRLLLARDRVKDQTFWLAQVARSALALCIFPLAGWLKPDVFGLVAADPALAFVTKRRESMGICFIGKRRFSDFIDEYIPPAPGDVRLLDDLGRVGVLDRHQGVHHYTLGQRMPLPHVPKACYVAELRHQSAEVMVVDHAAHPALYHRQLLCGAPHWLSDTVSSELLRSGAAGFTCEFRWQNMYRSVTCQVSPYAAVAEPDAPQHGTGCADEQLLDLRPQLQVTLHQCMRCVAAGQYAVFYRGEECLGSALVVASRSLWDEDRSCGPVSWSHQDYVLRRDSSDVKQAALAAPPPDPNGLDVYVPDQLQHQPMNLPDQEVAEQSRWP